MAILKENGWLIARPAIDNRPVTTWLAVSLAKVQTATRHQRWIIKPAKVHMPVLSLAA